MGQSAAKEGDQVTATDTHIVLVPSASGTVPTPLPHLFTGEINGELSSDVNIEGKPAATQGSTAENKPSHTPTPPGVSFQSAPSNKATIEIVSQTVNINGKGAARSGDTAKTCNDPTDLPIGTVIAQSSVLVG